MSVTPEQLAAGRAETHKHIGRVQYFLRLMIEELDKRALKHDASKLESPEAEIYAEFGPQLDKVEYMSSDYKALLSQVQPALDHHYSKNRHHPQHWPNGIDGMSLIDLCEMMADWKASTERNKNGNIRTSIEKNVPRFNISPQLAQIMQNTVRELFQD